uniref:uncharacterized protein n=1 Tax=Myxine glutinosa TaxID=7769 RepID=UPI00358DF6BE
MHADNIDPRTGLTVAVLSVTLFFGFMFVMAGMKGESLGGIPLIAIGMSICIPAVAIMFAAKKTQGFRTCLVLCKDPEKSGEEEEGCKSTVVVIAPLGRHVRGRGETGMLAPDTSSEDDHGIVDAVPLVHHVDGCLKGDTTIGRPCWRPLRIKELTGPAILGLNVTCRRSSMCCCQAISLSPDHSPEMPALQRARDCTDMAPGPPGSPSSSLHAGNLYCWHLTPVANLCGKKHDDDSDIQTPLSHSWHVRSVEGLRAGRTVWEAGSPDDNGHANIHFKHSMLSAVQLETGTSETIV